jgi:hypothetical protein
VRRCFVEVIITCYQMIVLVEARALNEPQPLCSTTVADVFPAASENEMVDENCGRVVRSRSSLEGVGEAKICVC